MPSPRYAPLTRHLYAAQVDLMDMTFGEVEAVLGRALPSSAGGRTWWANTTSHSQSQGWMDAGWRVDQVDVDKRRVRFHREMRPGVGEAPKAFVLDLPSGLSGAAQRMIQDYAEETGTPPQQAMTTLLNELALERRRKVIEWYAARARPQTTDSVALIREDRDGR